MLINKYVTFVVHNEELGIPVEDVNYIELPSEVTKVPQSINYIQGISTIRGSVIPLFDLKHYLFNNETRIDKSHLTRIIGVKIDDHEVGLIVDEAREVMDIRDDAIQKVSSISGDADYYNVAKIDERLIMLTSPKEIINVSNVHNVVDEINKQKIAL